MFPRLRPLVAAMGWDLLSGQIKKRRELMQLLWISKPPELLQDASFEVGQLEDVSFSMKMLLIMPFLGCVLVYDDKS